MKINFYIFLFASLTQSISGQVGVGTSDPNPSALLDLTSSDKGLLIPRISLTQTTEAQPLQAHVPGMLIYNLADTLDVRPGYYINDGIKWISISEAIMTVDEQEAIINNLKNQIPVKRAVFIAGQSNTTWGGGSAIIPDFSGKSLSQLGRSDANLQVVPLTFYGTYQHTRNLSGGSFGSVFLYHYYNQLVLDYPGREIQLLLIPCGAGASGWAASQYPGNSWRTDAAYYADITARIKWAKSNGYQIDAILWHQGETDAVAQTINYKDILKNFIQSLRDYAGNQQLPFILGEMVQSWVAADINRIPYQNIINAIPEEVPFTATSSATGLTLADDIHFDAAAHVVMGQRYFNQFLSAQDNTSPQNYTAPMPGEYIIYNFISSGGQVFPDIFSALRFGQLQTDSLYSALGDIWKYKNDDGYYHFKLEVVSGVGIDGGIFEWKQRINPFGLSETHFEDKSGFTILANTIGLNTSSGQGFTSLVYDTPVNSSSFTTLFHADTRTAANLWWFSVGQTQHFGNVIPIVETNNTVRHVRLSCIKE